MGQRGPAGLLDERKQAEICAILANGGSQADAAHYVGCSPGTVCNTAKRDPVFAALLQRARSTCTVECMTQISLAGAKSWRAAAWILERTQPEQYEKVNLRQASAKQLNGFWRACGDELLAGLPTEQQDLLRQRFKQVAKSYAARPFEDFGQEEDDLLLEEDAGDCAAESSDWEEGAGDISSQFSELETSDLGEMPDQLESEILDSNPIQEVAAPAARGEALFTEAPSAGLWQSAAAAALLVASLLWGSLVQVGSACRAEPRAACSPNSQIPPSRPDLQPHISENLERFPPSASRFAFKVSPVANHLPHHPHPPAWR